MDKKQMGLSRYIDQLNNEKKPKEHGTLGCDAEYERLLETVRRVRLLREIDDPTQDYPMQLAAGIKERVIQKGEEERTDRRKRDFPLFYRIVLYSAAVATVAAMILFLPRLFMREEKFSIVYAMEKAISELEAYHGTISVIESNDLGEVMIQAVREIWADQKGNYYVKELEGTAKGITTINNGEKKWQLRPREKASYLYATFPDPYRFTFELAQEMDEVKAALTVEEIGEDSVAGRSTTILRVTPKGGSPYLLWVDRETNLPLQRETAIQNAIRYRVTYTAIEFLPEIPKKLLLYQLPEGFTEVDTDDEQVINTMEEAEGMIGFQPIIVDPIPLGYSLSKIAVRKEKQALILYYITDKNANTVRIEQRKASEELKADSMAVLGKINGNLAELVINPTGNSIRWQEEGLEFHLIGDIPMKDLLPFLRELTQGSVEIPEGAITSKPDIGNRSGENRDNSMWKDPEISTEIDLKIEESEQKSVDAGHSPWKLDPVFVSQVFASLLLSPEGVIGEYPISYEDIVIIENDGSRAIAWIKSENTLAEYIYLKRLIRQDETGIWTVIGYDRPLDHR